MCSKAAVIALLSGVLGALQADQEAEDEDGQYGPGMSPEEKAKADRTLLTEYGYGQRKVLPERKPLGPVPVASMLGPRGGY